MDEEFKTHLGFVLNQCLQAIRKEGLSQVALERIGKLLFRLYSVFKAYKKKKRRYSLKNWLEQLIEIGKDLKDAV